jgi:hypothetical protein
MVGPKVHNFYTIKIYWWENVRWKMLDLQHQYNNCTTIPHMRVGPTYWSPLLCEGLLCSCCIGVVQESNPILVGLMHVDLINVSWLCKRCAFLIVQNFFSC